MTLYAKRDTMAQGEHYTRHVSAMTAEGLHAKSDIAAELAHRDMEIERLRAAVAAERERCCRVVVVQRDDRMWEVARRTILAIRAGDDYFGDVDDEGLLRA